MALPTHQYSYQQTTGDQPGTSLDGKLYAFNAEDSSAVLDPAILEPEMMQNPVVVNYHKASFVNGTGMLSPADSHTWEQKYHDNVSLGRPEDAYKVEGNQYIDSMQSQHHINQGLSNDGWTMSSGSNHGTPTTGMDMLPPPPPQSQQQRHQPHQQYTNMNYMHLKPAEAQGQQSLHSERFVSAAPVSGGSEWMALAQADVEARSLSKRLRSSSPPRPLMDMHRRDGGIQKKNKRIDIPQERNIQTIDQMIENTKDEELLKELKAQKRLLRNREAALASRQRKKKHTEELESKEKGHQSQVTVLEQQLEVINAQREEFEQDRQILIHRDEEAQRFIEALQMEKRDMLMKHNEETASLRRKVQILTEQLESASAPAMSAAPSSTGFTDFNAEMEALNMGTHDWDNFLFMHDSHTDDSTELNFGTPQMESAKSNVLDKTPTTQSNINKLTHDQPVASGLLFMLLLCGAFVASKPASTMNLNLPPMPEDVRAAAPTVLSNLLSEASKSADTRHVQSLNREPVPSMAPMVSTRSGNRMAQMHRSLTTPTRQQEIDSAFALTPSQYASLTNTDLPVHLDVASVAPRRTLAQALAESHVSRSENKAEIYTRSLLWEHIPTDVVNQFRELVRDHQDLTTREQRPH